MLSGPVLGLFVECNFQGPVSDNGNMFSNIDRLLRSKGFSLFDIECFRYSRAALPKPFLYNIPAQTTEGQILWGDALYLRDAAKPDYERIWKMEFSPEKLLKLACLFELYGLEDCTAELLINYKERLSGLINIDEALDMLTPSLAGRKMTYRQYNDAFEKNIEIFFPGEPPVGPKVNTLAAKTEPEGNVTLSAPAITPDCATVDLPDRLWVETASFVKDQIRAGEFVLSPSEFECVFPGHVIPYGRVGGRAFQWAIIHKGMLDEAGRGLLSLIDASFTPVFANEVFVAFAKKTELPDVRASEHYKALRAGLNKLGAFRRLKAAIINFGLQNKERIKKVPIIGKLAKDIYHRIKPI